MDGYEQVAAVMKALGHPVRLRILDVLRQEEACVCHLEAVLGQRQAYISQQLMKLRDAGLVGDRRDGQNVFYSLTDPSIGTLAGVARLATEAAVARDGERLIFSLPARPVANPCSCPRCETPSEAELSSTANGRVGRQ